MSGQLAIAIQVQYFFVYFNNKQTSCTNIFAFVSASIKGYNIVNERVIMPLNY